MGLRDILVTLLVFGSLPIIFRRPYVGVLVWSWLSYMNPHRLTWGFAHEMPFAQIVALVLFVATLSAREKATLPKDSVISLWIIFIIWMCVTTLFALNPDSAQSQLIKVLKIQIMTFFTLLLINDRQKLDQLIWVIVISIGYYSVKGGLFTLMTGGGYRVYGPSKSFIAENNALALASLMIIPLMIYLYKISKSRKWVQLVLGAAILLTAVSALGSQSRGALIAVMALAGFFWLKTKTKLLSGMAICVVAVLLFNFMPESWHARMSTITNYEEDASAMGRINAWGYAINVANHRLTGAGLESWNVANFARYASDPEDVHAAHSIYFSSLADHGWIGLAFFVAILFLTWRSLAMVIRTSAQKDSTEDIGLLAKMIQVSLVAYMSGGAFLSLAYFDLPWHLVAIAVVIKCRIMNISAKASIRPQFGMRRSLSET